MNLTSYLTAGGAWASGVKHRGTRAETMTCCWCAALHFTKMNLDSWSWSVITVGCDGQTRLLTGTWSLTKGEAVSLFKQLHVPETSTHVLLCVWVCGRSPSIDALMSLPLISSSSSSSGNNDTLASASPRWRRCLQHLPQDESWRHPNQM